MARERPLSADSSVVLARLLVVAVGAGAGGAARYVVGGAVQSALGPRFPYGTLAVNLAGCFLIGAFVAFAEMRLISPQIRVLVVPGLLGGFTTFSAFAFETDAFLYDGQPASAMANVLASVVGGLLAVMAGRWAVRAIGL